MRLALELQLFYLSVAFVKKSIVSLRVEWHFENKMEFEVIDLDISLLIVKLMNLEPKSILSQWNFNFLPYFKLVVKFN